MNDWIWYAVGGSIVLMMAIGFVFGIWLMVHEHWLENHNQSAARATEKIPCPVSWPDCSPDGCSKCEGKGYTEELRH